MATFSKKLEEKRAKLARLIERKAFDAYVRHGAVPDDVHRLAETAADGRKFLDLCAGLSVKALPDGRPTTHYTWRTAGDDRVRHTHAALEGQVFSWTNAPSEGHPGTAPNCRCWAEPYYGNPALPDAFLQLQSERRVSSNPAELWASIDTLSRPDGSVAASHIRMTDGTSVQSTFSGPNTSQMVSLPDGGFYQLNSTGDARQIAVGQNGQTVVKVAWLRQSLVPRLLPPPPAEAIILPDYDPNVQLDVPVTPAALVLRGAAVLYNLAVAAPKPLGLGEDDYRSSPSGFGAVKIWARQVPLLWKRLLRSKWHKPAGLCPMFRCGPLRRPPFSCRSGLECLPPLGELLCTSTFTA